MLDAPQRQRPLALALGLSPPRSAEAPPAEAPVGPGLSPAFLAAAKPWLASPLRLRECPTCAATYRPWSRISVLCPPCLDAYGRRRWTWSDVITMVALRSTLSPVPAPDRRS